MNVKKLKDKDLAWADYAFISAMSVQSKSVDDILSRCQCLGVKTVGGGPLFTAWHDKYERVDHLVLNEAEITLPLFVKDLMSGCARHIYTSDAWADMRATPIPQWDLINKRKYASMNIQYSRGCPFNCEFCDIVSLYGHEPRLKTKQQIIAELNALFLWGWRGNVFFVDDNFIGNKTILKKEILPAIIDWMKERSFPFSFFTEASVNLSDDDELIHLMVEAGFNMVFIGIETPNEESLAECGKHQNRNRDLLSCVKKLHRSGLQVQGGFIVGFDSDPESIFRTLVDFIQESGIVTAMVGLLTAMRGTRLFNRLQDEGRILKKDTGDNTDFSINFIPRMDSDTLIQGYQSVIKDIYSPQNYYTRVRQFLKDYNLRARRSIRMPSWRDIYALFKSTFQLGFVDKNYKEYWKFMLWTVTHRPILFPMAVSFAIYGYHFRKVYESNVAFESEAKTAAGKMPSIEPVLASRINFSKEPPLKQ